MGANRMRLRSGDISWQEIDGELVILDLDRSVYLTTNPTGTFLVKRLAEETSVEDLVDALVEEFGIERRRAQDDVAAFLSVLAEKRLLA